jgi:hypothetical protein
MSIMEMQELIEKLAEALEEERSLTGIECSCITEQRNGYVYTCVSCKGEKALDLYREYRRNFTCQFI